MKTIIVDDEPILMNALARILNDYNGIDIVSTFTNPLEALEYIKTNAVDLVFLDVEMPGMNGIDVGKEIKQFSPSIAIIYATGYEKYAIEAFRLYAQGYILKPYDHDEVFAAIDNAKHLMKPEKRVSAVTFGNFDVFIDGKSIHFSRSKAKELLALLIDRCGGEVTLDTVIDVLWYDLPYDETVRQLARKIVSSLKLDLANYGIENICNFNYGVYSVNPSEFDCDYYKFLSGDNDAIKSFFGEYMFQYAWGEYTLPKLLAIVEQNQEA